MRFLAVFLALGLAGCATAAQRQSVAINARAAQANTAFQACMAGAIATPAGEVMAAKMPLKGGVTLAELGDASYVTPEQVAALSDYHQAMQPCRSAIVQAYLGFAPGMSNLLAEMFEGNDRRVLDLIQKKTTWGEYNKSAQDAGVKLQVAMTAEAQRIDAGLAEANAQEMQQRQQAAQAYLNYMQNQAAINAANRPITTNCTRFGMQVSCTTN